MNDLTEGYYCTWTESDGRHSLRFGSLDEAKAKCDAVRARALREAGLAAAGGIIRT